MIGVDGLLWLAAAALAGAATWLTLPRPVALDWELYFKLALATVLRGQVEAEGGEVEAWIARCRARIWYHPGGRELATKLMDPSGYAPPVPALPGERALLEALSRRLPAERTAWLLAEGRSDERLYEDPAGLGAAYDLERTLGPGAGWDALADGAPALLEALRRRNAHNRWVVLGEGPLALGVTAALLDALGPDGAARLDAAALADPEALAHAMDALLPAPSSRLVVLVMGGAVGPLLRCLHANPGLRDRARLIVGVGADLGAERAWLAAHFDHEQMDTEIARAVPYAHLGFAVPGPHPLGEPGAPLADTRFPAPPVPPSGRASLAPMALGLLPGPAADYPPALLAWGLLIAGTVRLSLDSA